MTIQNSNTKQKKKNRTINLSVPEELLLPIIQDAKRQGISTNQKVNEIFRKYVYCYRFSEAGGAILASRDNMKIFLEKMNRADFLKTYRINVSELAPAVLFINQKNLTLENWVEYCCNGMLKYGGSFDEFSHFFDEATELTNLVFRHQFGLDWSSIMNEVYTEFLEKKLYAHVESREVGEKVLVLRIRERVSPNAHER